MAGYTSLESSIRGCQVNAGNADKLYSDRFLNPGNMVCPIWNGYDGTGRPVCADSQMTKSLGCNSAEDRVNVENNQRPQYIEYVNLSSGGINGDFYGSTTQPNQIQTNADMQALNNITGNFGMQFKSNVRPSSNCVLYSYEQTMQQQSVEERQAQAETIGYNTNFYKNLSGCNF
jgi:hypothetical protein